MRSSKANDTPIIFVRHGQTDFPSERIYCDGREDPPLNAAGLAQAQRAAEFLRAAPVVKIYASPAARTLATAQAIAATTGAPVETREPLRERCMGPWDGLTFADIQTRWPEDFTRWKQDQTAFKLSPGGESMYDVAARVQAVLDEIITAHVAHLVVVVSHNGAIRAALCQALRIPLEFHRTLNIDYGALSRVDYGTSQHNFMYLGLMRSAP